MSKEYPHIPQQLLEYRSLKLVEAFNHQGEAKTWRAIDDQFRIVSEITRLKPDDLLLRLGFDARNLDRYSLQSLFGVMRTVVTLRNLGFVAITPLPPRQDRKEADLLAKRQVICLQLRYSEPMKIGGGIPATTWKNTSGSGL